MKPSNVIRVFNESISNLTRNTVLTITSILTVLLTLVLVGVFGIIILTISYNSTTLDEMLEIKIFIDPAADEGLTQDIGRQIEEDDRVSSLVFISKEQAYEAAKLIIDEDVLKDMGPDFLPASYVIKLNDYSQGEQFVYTVQRIPQVYRVIYHNESVQFTLSYTKWIRYISGILALFLAVLTVFLVSNTIKLTMYARNDEVAIMKYIGATESRIKMPFVIEGAIIGLIGAMLALLIVGYVYARVYGWFNLTGYEDLFLSGIIMIPVDQVIAITMFLFVTCGMTLGTVGSMMAIRKYLKV
ncbi:MAG: permease-like cell division protein FtsX [Clostridia bacterium]